MMSVFKKKKKKVLPLLSWTGKGQDLFLLALFTHKPGLPRPRKLSVMVSSTLWRQNCEEGPQIHRRSDLSDCVHAPGWCPTHEILHSTIFKSYHLCF